VETRQSKILEDFTAKTTSTNNKNTVCNGRKKNKAKGMWRWWRWWWWGNTGGW
jgi:hypothetical protein